MLKELINKIEEQGLRRGNKSRQLRETLKKNIDKIRKQYKKRGIKKVKLLKKEDKIKLDK